MEAKLLICVYRVIITLDHNNYNDHAGIYINACFYDYSGY